MLSFAKSHTHHKTRDRLINISATFPAAGGTICLSNFASLQACAVSNTPNEGYIVAATEGFIAAPHVRRAPAFVIVPEDMRTLGRRSTWQSLASGDRGAGRWLQVRHAGCVERRSRQGRRWRGRRRRGRAAAAPAAASRRTSAAFRARTRACDAACPRRSTDFPADPIIDPSAPANAPALFDGTHAARRRRALHHLADRGDADAAQLAAAALRAGARRRREPVRDRPDGRRVRAPAAHLHAQPEHGARPPISGTACARRSTTRRSR